MVKAWQLLYFSMSEKVESFCHCEDTGGLFMKQRESVLCLKCVRQLYPVEI